MPGHPSQLRVDRIERLAYLSTYNMSTANQISAFNTSGGYGMTTSTNFVISGNISATRKRGPYKKDKFNVTSTTQLGMNVTDVVGKVKTLAQIGEMLDNLKPNETFSLQITKRP
jgi:hypothetical protein